jgi:hypothetical protein
MYPYSNQFKPTLADQTENIYRNDGNGPAAPTVHPPNFPTGGYPYPFRRGLAPFQQQGFNPFLSNFSAAPPRAPWSPRTTGGFGPGAFPFNQPQARPTSSLFGFGGPRQQGSGPKLDPDAIREFVTNGVGRLNSLMSGIDKVSKTVQQMGPLIQMFQGLKGAKTSTSAPASTDLDTINTDFGATPNRKRSSAKRSRAQKGSTGRRSR